MEDFESILEPSTIRGVDGKYHFIYLTKNLVNGKLYYGKRTTPSLEYWYVGSGTLLWAAILKYGKDNFKRKIISFHESRDAVAAAERIIVNDTVVESDQYYNLMLGGYGGDTRNFYKNQTPLENALKSAKTLKSRPDMLAARNKKIGDRKTARFLAEPNYFKDRAHPSHLRGHTKSSNPFIVKQVESRRKNHLEKMNLILDEVKSMDGCTVAQVTKKLGISRSTVHRCRLRNKLNLRWEDAIPDQSNEPHGLKGTTSDKCPWRTVAAQKTAEKIRGVYVGDKSARSKITDVQRKEILDLVLKGTPRKDIQRMFLHMVTLCTINKHMRIALESKNGITVTN